MINEKENTKISKLLSLVLRHQPEAIGIQLDENGWTDVQTLIEKVKLKGFQIDETILKYAVDTNAKKRFAYNETRKKIRASQGHSVEIELGYSPQKPPEILYHGTAQESVNSIFEAGLLKRDRHHVHLSQDIQTAIKVGQRHGKPFVFEVLAAQMENEKYEFYFSANEVWLTDHVPPKFLRKFE